MKKIYADSSSPSLYWSIALSNIMSPLFKTLKTAEIIFSLLKHVSFYLLKPKIVSINFAFVKTAVCNSSTLRNFEISFNIRWAGILIDFYFCLKIWLNGTLKDYQIKSDSAYYIKNDEKSTNLLGNTLLINWRVLTRFRAEKWVEKSHICKRSFKFKIWTYIRFRIQNNLSV